jgi:hypothetical protein
MNDRKDIRLSEIIFSATEFSQVIILHQDSGRPASYKALIRFLHDKGVADEGFTIIGHPTAIPGMT